MTYRLLAVLCVLGAVGRAGKQIAGRERKQVNPLRSQLRALRQKKWANHLTLKI